MKLSNICKKNPKEIFDWYLHEVKYRINSKASTSNLAGIVKPYELYENRSNGPFPFYMKFQKIQNGQKYHHSLKEHPMFSKIAKFGCEML